MPGTTPETDYYGIDQIGSVRRVFASTSSAPAYSYDPYGNPLQTTTPLTDFTYAGMFANTDSGLNLTLYRAYDPVAGRWLSRDPLGETSNAVGNLYPYVGGNPISNVDPLGLISDRTGNPLSPFGLNRYTNQVPGAAWSGPFTEQTLRGFCESAGAGSRQWTFRGTGGYDAALEAWRHLGATDVSPINTTYGPGFTGLINGQRASIRPGSSGGYPTIQIGGSKYRFPK